MRIYLINRPCDDHYYSGHSAGVAFTTREKAQAYLDEKYPTDPDDAFAYMWEYYISEVEVLE